jgi:glycosyltransferase involved in cell wall biosynthesis
MSKGQPLRIAFMSSSDPLDINSFSTVLFHMVGALRQLLPDLDVVQHSRPPWTGRLIHYLRRLGYRGEPYYWDWLNRWSANRLARRWAGERAVVISVVNATMVGPLSRHVPVINLSDSTFVLMRNFYASFAALSDAEARSADAAEGSAIRNAVHNSFSSRWAAQSAVADYGADPAETSVVSWGCNLARVPATAILEPQLDAPCRLLFIAGEWERKGGDVVLEAARILKGRGVPVVLDLVGAVPPDGLPEGVPGTAHGRLGKGDPRQLEALLGLYRDASFLFLPTRQDCTPMVFAEANAYGTPAITRDTGGVASVVHHGENGLVLPNDASATAFADAIEHCWRDRAGYLALRTSSRATYENRLNWDVWAQEMVSIIRRLEATGKV